MVIARKLRRGTVGSSDENPVSQVDDLSESRVAINDSDVLWFCFHDSMVLYLDWKERTMGRVVIAGCGYVGTRVGEILAEEGHLVWGIRRNPTSLPPSIQPIRADLSQGDRWVPPRAEFDMAVYSASPDAPNDTEYERVFVNGLIHFLAQLKDCSPDLRRILFVSSTGVYGDSKGNWVDEECPTEPEGFSGRRVLEGEKLLLDSGLPGLVVRLGGIYGPQRASLVEKIRTRRVQLAPAPRFSNRIHREDCARAIAHLSKIENPRRIYNVVDSYPCDRNVVYEWIAQRLEVTLDREENPRFPTLSGKRCRNRRLIESGYRFLYPSFREGYAELITGHQTDPEAIVSEG